jgi:CHRD domain
MVGGLGTPDRRRQAMKGRLKWAVGVAVLAGAAAVGTVAVAGGGKEVREDLTGYEEVPAISTTGNGSFKAKIDRNGQQISYRLSYAELEGTVTQAHIHIGQRAVNGKIAAFLCSNLPSPPPGTPACPAAPGTVEGTIEAADVLDTTTPPPETAGQGIEAGAFGELVDAIRAGVTYANVHTTKWPGGEIRAQLEDDHRSGDRDD